MTEPTIILGQGSTIHAKAAITSPKGQNNRIELGAGVTLGSTKAKVTFTGSNNALILEDGVFIKNGDFNIEGDNITVRIGRKTRMNGAYLFAAEGAGIEIGEDCLFATGLEMRTSDAHIIRDMDTLERINPANPIKIGNHVWCGKRVEIMPGVTMVNDIVVGLGSIVTRDVLEANVGVAGRPAKIGRRRIIWDRQRFGD